MADYEKLRHERFASPHNPVLQDYYKALLTKPSLPSLGVEGMRARIPQPPPEALQDPDVTYEDTTVDGPHGPIPLRIFRPQAMAGGPNGIYVHIHHGGYIMFGGLDAMTPNNIRLTKMLNCIVVG